MRLDTNFAERLRWAITHKNSNQSELAREIGISVQAVQQWASGATASPNIKHLHAAAQFLGVRYDWLAYARGVMVDSPGNPEPHDPGKTAAAMLASEWQAQLSSIMPLDAGSFGVKIGHNGLAYRIDYLTDARVALFGLYSQANSLINAARGKMWLLSVARAILPPLPGRAFLLLLAPLDDDAPSISRQYELLHNEARLLHIDVVAVQSPHQAAQVLQGDYDPKLPEELTLGIDDSPVL
jgi:transcriptional regulator with XRE-family HTH domain